MPKATTNPKTPAAQSVKGETFPSSAAAVRMTFTKVVSFRLLLWHENNILMQQ